MGRRAGQTASQERYLQASSLLRAFDRYRDLVVAVASVGSG